MTTMLATVAIPACIRCFMPRRVWEKEPGVWVKASWVAAVAPYREIPTRSVPAARSWCAAASSIKDPLESRET